MASRNPIMNVEYKYNTKKHKELDNGKDERKEENLFICRAF